MLDGTSKYSGWPQQKSTHRRDDRFYYYILFWFLSSVILGITGFVCVQDISGFVVSSVCLQVDTWILELGNEFHVPTISSLL